MLRAIALPCSCRSPFQRFCTAGVRIDFPNDSPVSTRPVCDHRKPRVHLKRLLSLPPIVVWSIKPFIHFSDGNASSRKPRKRLSALTGFWPMKSAAALAETEAHRLPDQSKGRHGMDSVRGLRDDAFSEGCLNVRSSCPRSRRVLRAISSSSAKTWQVTISQGDADSIVKIEEKNFAIECANSLSSDLWKDSCAR